MFAGYHLATTIATPAAYAYLPFAFASLGWAPGIILLLMGIIAAWYASILLASLHKFNGIRYVRFRDLGRAIAGNWCAYTIAACQQIASLGNNITLAIVAGTCMKALDQSFNPSTASMTLQQWIIIFGCTQLVLSQFPTIHDLRVINVMSTICTAGFAITATGLSIYNGKNPVPVEDPDTGEMIIQPVSYSVTGSSTANIVFSVFSALGTIGFAFGDTLLPEIQATLGEPVKLNMYKAIHFCFSTISASYLMTSISGYWAFGNAVQPYLVASFAGPSWGIRLANFFALLNFVGCFQIHARASFDLLEIWTLDANQPLVSVRNCLGRFVGTTLYCSLITFIGCMFPFFGDFLALTGAIGFTPLVYLLPFLLWGYVNKECSTVRKWIHNLLFAFYFAVMVLGSVGAMRYIITNVVNYSVFVNL